MSFLKVYQPGECPETFTQMIENPPSLDLILQQIRLSRMKLGSVLERLESFDPNSGGIPQFHDHAECVAIEVQLMIETLRQLSGD